MFSERRCAQFGLGSAALVLITTLTILFQGNVNRAPAGQPGRNLGMVVSDHASANDASVRTAMAK